MFPTMVSFKQKKFSRDFSLLVGSALYNSYKTSVNSIRKQHGQKTKKQLGTIQLPVVLRLSHNHLFRRDFLFSLYVFLSS